MKNNRLWMLLWIVLVALTSLSSHPAVADPVDLSNTVSEDYNSDQKLTIVYAHEKLVDGTTSLGASYNFNGHTMQSSPKMVSFSIFGYHDDVQWQKVDTVILTWNGKDHQYHALHSLHGEDRDKSSDLVQAKYFESILVALPITDARQMFSSSVLTVHSIPALLDMSFTSEQMGNCQDLLGTIKAAVVDKAPSFSSIADSKNGMPITRTVTEASGDVTLASSLVQISPTFAFRILAFTTISGQKRREPTTAFFLTEISDTPVLSNEADIDVSYGANHISLSSNVNKSGASAGVTVTARTYLISYTRFMEMSKAKSLTLIVDQTKITIPQQKMAGIYALAKQMQH